MRSLMYKVKKRLRSKRGETLVEAIVSILLLAILLGTVTAMIQVSLNLTARALDDATRLQDNMFNPAILGSPADFTMGTVVSGGTLIFITQNSDLIETKHDIDIYLDVNEDIISFIPPDTD